MAAKVAKVQTQRAEGQEHQRPALGAPPRTLISAALVLLKWLFRVTDKRQRWVLARLPGVLPLYRSLSRLIRAASSEDGIPCAHVNGLKMYLDPQQEASHTGAYLWGQYAPVAAAVFSEAITEGDTVVDVGAHWGYFTLLGASLCGPRGRVIAFEPHPTNFALLAKNVRANGLTNVLPIQKAVSDRTGSAKLFIARRTVSHSLCELPPDWRVQGNDAAEAIVVDTVALDDFFAQDSVQPRLIKMNIEGAERLALAGMRRLIEHSPLLVLISEFDPSHLSAKAGADLLDQLTGSGFEVAALDDYRHQLAVGPKDTVLDWLFEAGVPHYLLATRDHPLFDRLLRLQDRSGRRIRHLKTIRG